MSDRPRVLLTLSQPGEGQPRKRSLYIAALEASGATVLPLFPGEEPPEEFDALCLSGGGDLHPRRYRQPVDGTEMNRVDEMRDETELDLARRAIFAKKPVLGICRGFQVLNVALGGGLLQHRDGHRGPDVKHEIVVAPGTLLAEACGRGPFRVNSWHHQGVHPRDLARDLRATVVVDDLVEAVELQAQHFGWCVGVQWHPERTTEVDAAAAGVFDAFVRAARGAAALPR